MLSIKNKYITWHYTKFAIYLIQVRFFDNKDEEDEEQDFFIFWNVVYGNLFFLCCISRNYFISFVITCGWKTLRVWWVRCMKHVLYEVTDNFDIIIKLTFENYTYLNAFIEQHTNDKYYEPKFLILEINDEGEIDFIRTYNGTKETSKKCVVDYLD